MALHWKSQDSDKCSCTSIELAEFDIFKEDFS